MRYNLPDPVLHTRIRLFVSIFNSSYKIPVRTWQLRSNSDKEIVKQKKAEVQAKFRDKMGLIVDMPKRRWW